MLAVLPRTHRTAPYPGILVAIEGIDGAGKTTQAVLLASRLAEAGLSVVLTKEPTDGPWGRRVRESAATGRLSPEDELNAFLEDRRQHVKEKIAPALEQGAVVIVDRYYFSTVAYQGSRGIPVAEILAMNEAFAPQPDALIVLTVDPMVGLARIAARGDVANEFEQIESLRKCAGIFSEIERPYLSRIDGHLSVDAVHQRIVEEFRSGPLFLRLCLKSYKEECEPEFCSFRLDRTCEFLSPVLSADALWRASRRGTARALA